jgi:hypothetical protein
MSRENLYETINKKWIYNTVYGQRNKENERRKNTQGQFGNRGGIYSLM